MSNAEEFSTIDARRPEFDFGMVPLGPGSTLALSRRAHRRLIRMVFVADVDGRAQWTGGARPTPDGVAFVQREIAARFCPRAMPRLCT